MGGQVIDPPVDRQRGFTAVLVHLRCGPPPNPDGKNYNILALGPEKGAADQRPECEIGTPTIFSGRADDACPTDQGDAPAARDYRLERDRAFPNATTERTATRGIRKWRRVSHDRGDPLHQELR